MPQASRTTFSPSPAANSIVEPSSFSYQYMGKHWESPTKRRSGRQLLTRQEKLLPFVSAMTTFGAVSFGLMSGKRDAF